MVANATDLFDTDSARIQPGGGPASPVNSTAVSDSAPNFDINSSAWSVTGVRRANNHCAGDG